MSTDSDLLDRRGRLVWLETPAAIRLTSSPSPSQHAVNGRTQGTTKGGIQAGMRGSRLGPNVSRPHELRLLQDILRDVTAHLTKNEITRYETNLSCSLFHSLGGLVPAAGRILVQLFTDRLAVGTAGVAQIVHGPLELGIVHRNTLAGAQVFGLSHGTMDCRSPILQVVLASAINFNTQMC